MSRNSAREIHLMPAIMLFSHFNFCFCIRVPALPGLVDQDNKSAAEEKKRAYQLELQKQVCGF